MAATRRRMLTVVVAMLVWLPGASRLAGQASYEIAGTVRDLSTNFPMPGIGVELVLDAVPRSPGPSDPNRIRESVVTDAQGRFRFTGLPPGSYRVTAAHPGVVNGRYTTARSGDLSGEASVRDLDLRLARLVRVTGTVRGADGEPVEGVLVTPMTLGWGRGQMEFDEALPFSVTVAQGTLREEVLDVLPGVLFQTGPDGRYAFRVTAGSYYLEVRSVRSEPRRSSEEDFEAYLASRAEFETPIAVYYPGVVAPARAVPLRFEADVRDLDLVYDPGETSRIRFRFVVPEELPGLPVSLAGRLAEEEAAVEVDIRALGTGPISSRRYSLDEYEVEMAGNGVYVLPPLPTGDYELDLSYSDRLDAVLRGHERSDLQPFARRRVSLRGEDVDLGEIFPIPNVPVSGRVVVEGNGGGLPPGDGLPGVISSDTGFGTARFSELAADQTFVLRGLPPGLHTLGYFGTLPEGWYVASIRSAGRDVLRDGLVVGGAVAPVEIRLRSDAGRVEGQVVGPDAVPATGAVVILIPPPDQRGPFARFPVTGTDPTGTFRFVIPPGDYRLLAVRAPGSSLGGNYWEGPDFLRRYEAMGEPITVAPASRVVIDAEPLSLAN